MPSALVERAEALFAELIPSQAERRRCCMAIYTTSTSWPLDANRGCGDRPEGSRGRAGLR